MNPQTDNPQAVNVLFLGGPLDGRRISVDKPGGDYIVPVVTDDEFITGRPFAFHHARYSPQYLSGGDGSRIPVYVSESLTLAGALRLLVDGYAGKRASGQAGRRDDHSG